MSRTAAQRRWRQKTQSRRVELYLSPETLAALDQAVEATGARGRAALVAYMVGQLTAVLEARDRGEPLEEGLRDLLEARAPEGQQDEDQQAADEEANATPPEPPENPLWVRARPVAGYGTGRMERIITADEKPVGRAWYEHDTETWRGRADGDGRVVGAPTLKEVAVRVTTVALSIPEIP